MRKKLNMLQDIEDYNKAVGGFKMNDEVPSLPQMFTMKAFIDRMQKNMDELSQNVDDCDLEAMTESQIKLLYWVLNFLYRTGVPTEEIFKAFHRYRMPTGPVTEVDYEGIIAKAGYIKERDDVYYAQKMWDDED